MIVGSLIDRFYHQKIVGRIFHTLVYCLQEQLEGCETALDIGCGPSSPLQYCHNIKYSIGVEPHKSYFRQSRKSKIHDKHICKRVEDLSFPTGSFDAVIMIEVIEHLPKKVGAKVLRKARKWAKKKIIVTTPNGFFPMTGVDKNPLQSHRSGWSIKDFEKVGYKCHGLAGAKFFYHHENQVTSMTDATGENLYANIRFKPKLLFYILNSLIQIFTYYVPQLSFEILAVKKVR